MTLHHRADHGDLAGIRRALEEGAAVDAYDEEGRTALMVAATSAKAGPETLQLLLELGANVNAVRGPKPPPFQLSAEDLAVIREAGLEAQLPVVEPRDKPPSIHSVLMEAVPRASREKLELLLQAGADASYVDPCGYNALLRAVYRGLGRDGRDVGDLIQRLAAAGAPLNGFTAYGECAVRVASQGGRFDLLQLLFDLGADPGPLGWNELHFAIAAGDVARVRAAVNAATVAARDGWERTPLLLAVQAGRQEIAELLLAAGADLRARGRCGHTALMFAAENDDAPLCEWLLAQGADPEEADEFGQFPLKVAVQSNAARSLRALLAAGADSARKDRFDRPLLEGAPSREIVEILTAHGAELADLDSPARRMFFGHGGEDDAPDFARVDPRESRLRVFGRKNPERMNSGFLETMIRARCSAYSATAALGKIKRNEPGWSFMRYGQSLTKLPDGRYVEIGGEHEDYYDEDFCIYNDVVVHHSGGGFELFGYPEAVFPPTDFHTATLLGEHLYLIGCLGYSDRRRAGFTPVYRLCLRTWAIEAISCTGVMPGWIYRHRARAVGADEIEITGGTIHLGEDEVANERVFRLNTTRRTWTAPAG